MTTPLNPQSYSPQRENSSDIQDMDLIVSESVDHQNEEIVVTNVSNKILLTISDDLIFTLSIMGDTFQSLVDGITSDDQLKTDWHSWHRFISNPDLYYVFIYDNDFQEYVRYRDSIPINHLSKMKIKNKLHVSHVCEEQNSHVLRGLDLDEPTDTLVSDTFIEDNNNQNENPININSDISTTYHNYTLTSPSAPSTNSSQHNTRSQPPTKAAKKVFNSSTASTSADIHRSYDSNVSIDSEDLFEDALTGPLHEWTQEATVTFLELCKPYSKDISLAKNVTQVDRNIWEQISRELSTKGFGYFDAFTCRNHFSRQRSTYTNILCYPPIANDTRWPYFDLMKSIIGERSAVNSRQAKLKAKKSFNSKQRRNTTSVMTNSANQEVNELYVALLNSVKKFNNDFMTEKKVETWNKIEKHLNRAGYKWNSNALRGLFHRLRYAYLNLLRSVGDEEVATQSWPYFRYFQGIDLSAFKGRKSSLSLKKSVLKLKPNTKIEVKRGPGRPRKHPIVSTNDSLNSVSGSEQINNRCEVTFYEYEDQDSDDNEVENKKK